MSTVNRSAFLGASLAILSTFGLASAGAAQEILEAETPPTFGSIPDQLERVFFSYDRDFYRNRTLPRQISFIAGPGVLVRDSFPENEVARDGKAINSFYREVLFRQINGGPVIRTLDLANPFNLSVRNLPTQASQPVAIPPATIIPAPTPIAPQTRPQVPALW